MYCMYCMYVSMYVCTYVLMNVVRASFSIQNGNRKYKAAEKLLSIYAVING